MAFRKHVDADELLNLSRRNFTYAAPRVSDTIATPYSSRYGCTEDIPKSTIPEDGINADAAYQLIHDELDFDGKPNLNVASFVNTYMEPEADKLITENLSKNLADADEYPAMIHIHQRCVNMLSHLWRIPEGEKAIGTATTGSSEAIHLGGLAMKRRWVEKRLKEGKDTSKPNILMGANAQVALEKFARYFDVEARIIPVSKESNYCIDVNRIRENLDENTIGIFVILGSTYTGHYEPVKQIADLLDKYEAETGIDIPIHVDGASGAMFCPFATPSVKFGFEIPRVKSINTHLPLTYAHNSSGHKYGLTYAGLGWILFRNKEQLPKHLIFELHYLGGTEETYTLNFSRPGNQVIAQYFSLIRLGLKGYINIARQDLLNARLLSSALEATSYYTCVSSIHHKLSTPAAMLLSEDNPERYVAGLPVVSFHFSDEFHKEFPKIKQASVSTLLRVRGWILPNYPLPPNEEKQEILRVVIRESFSSSMVDRLVEDIVEVTETLMIADDVEIGAYAHPSIPKDIERDETWDGWGNWKKGKADEFKAKMKEQQQTGIFKRGAC